MIVVYFILSILIRAQNHVIFLREYGKLLKTPYFVTPMKRILLAILLVALLIGCSAKKAPEVPEEHKVVVDENAPKSFTLTLDAT